MAWGKGAPRKILQRTFLYSVKLETACCDLSHYTLDWGVLLVIRLSIYIPPEIWQGPVSVHERMECHKSGWVMTADFGNPMNLLHLFPRFSLKMQIESMAWWDFILKCCIVYLSMSLLTYQSEMFLKVSWRPIKWFYYNNNVRLMTTVLFLLYFSQ